MAVGREGHAARAAELLEVELDGGLDAQLRRQLLGTLLVLGRL